MYSKERYETYGSQGRLISMDSQEKMLREASMPHLRDQPTCAKKPTPIRRILLAGSLVLLTMLCFATLRQRMSCHGVPPGQRSEAGPESFTSLLKTASIDGVQELLHKYFPERHTIEAAPHVNSPLTTTLLRLVRREDNTTVSSTPSPTPSSPQSTLPPPPPRTEPSNTPTTTPTPTAPTKSTTSSANQPPPPDPTPVSPTTVTNPGTSASSSKEDRVQDTGSSGTTKSPASSGTTKSTALTKAEETSSTTDEPRPPSIINGGTLTRSTTKDSSQDNVDAQGSTRTSTRSSKMVVATLTSTLSNGNVVVVTATSYVPPDPVVTFSATTVIAPSLHNEVTRPRCDSGTVAAIMVVVVGAVLGAAMV